MPLPLEGHLTCERILGIQRPIARSVVRPGFSLMQGGPHNHTIAGLACALKQAQEPEFKAYQEQVLKNSKSMAEELDKLGYNIVSGGLSPATSHSCLYERPMLSSCLCFMSCLPQFRPQSP